MTEPLHDYALPEHPDATRLRLRNDGDWEEADQIYTSEYRRHYNKFRKANGGKSVSLPKRVEATYMAWKAVYALYPVPADAAPMESLKEYLLTNSKARPVRRLPALTEADHARFDDIGSASDTSGDSMWVYHNLENPSVRADDCPSRGAWYMLNKARRNSGWFYEKVYRPLVPHLMKQQVANADEEYKPSKAEKLAVAELDEMIQEAVEASK